jgi:hypothetical protein
MSKKSKLSCHLGWDNLETMIEKRWLPHAEAIKQKENSKNHFLVKYEDLIKSPFEIISKICCWLDVGLPPDATKQTVLGGRFVEKLYAEPSQKGVSTPVEVKKDLSKTYQYEEVITPRERDFIIWRLLGPSKQFGYFKNFTKPSRIKLFFQWTLPDKWEFKNVDTLKKAVRALIAFFYRRFYIFKNILTQ